jgi:hypothetical protein
MLGSSVALGQRNDVGAERRSTWIDLNLNRAAARTARSRNFDLVIREKCILR